MKCILSILLFLSTIATQATVLTFPLNELEVRLIPVSRWKVTTILFPGAIQALTAVNVTSQATNLGGFQLDFRPGSSFFALRALQPGAAANVNVLFGGRTYVFEVTESERPALSVIMQALPPSNILAQRQGPVTPTRLIGILQKAKAFDLLVKSHPQSVWGVTRVTPLTLTEYPEVDIRVEEVFRFDPEDTLVLRLWMRNKSQRRIAYEGFSIRIGERVYPQSIMDAKGALEPKEDQIAYVGVTGSPDGSRNNLSLKNEFKVSLR